jgi:hypothetical protein
MVLYTPHFGTEVKRMSEHYVCRGTCGGKSDVPKACDTDSCTMVGAMMEACNCVDDLHVKAVAEEPTDENEVV